MVSEVVSFISVIIIKTADFVEICLNKICIAYDNPSNQWYSWFSCVRPASSAVHITYGNILHVINDML